ncbi:hypothetical protein RND71_014052 [Anisodus tanguticus]|uniref:Uncharacterized protein n=1 Tax=Anisodus tanguticus TaxID=243964 RepID=A0AAE1VER1_9SOLA|nr:hypothetical protein RND71_014052 [Anisodus tanguticus]
MATDPRQWGRFRWGGITVEDLNHLRPFGCLHTSRVHFSELTPFFLNPSLTPPSHFRAHSPLTME